MENKSIITLEYKEDATILMFKNPVIIMFYIALALGSLYTLYQDFSNSIGGYIGISIFLFFFVLIMHIGILKNIMDYHTLEIFKDYIIINKEEKYPIKDINFEVQKTGAGATIRTNGIVKNLQGQVIGIFVFNLSIHSLFDISANSTKELINNLKNGVSQNYTNFLSTQKEELIEENKTATKVGLYLSLILIIPALIAITIIYS